MLFIVIDCYLKEKWFSSLVSLLYNVLPLLLFLVLQMVRMTAYIGQTASLLIRIGTFSQNKRGFFPRFYLLL